VVRRLKSDGQVTAGAQTLQERSGSGLATIPHDFLERDDVIDDGEFPDEQNLVVDRLDRRVYLVRLTDDGSIPDVERPKRSSESPPSTCCRAARSGTSRRRRPTKSRQSGG